MRRVSSLILFSFDYDSALDDVEEAAARDRRSVLRQRPEATVLRDSGEEPALRRTDDGPSRRDSVATSADREGVGAVEQGREVDLRRG